MTVGRRGTITSGAVAAVAAWALASGALASGALASARATAAATPNDLSAQLNHAWRGAGASSSAYVVDLSSDLALLDANGAVSRSPASVEKLYTTSTVLGRFGPDGQLDTTVLGAGTLDSAGVWHGDLYLHGGGDPTFGSEPFVHSAYHGGTTVTALARKLEDAGITHVTGAVIGDESLFDPLRGGPRTGFRFDADLTGVLSALAFDRGRQGTTNSPAAYAALQLAGALRHDGVGVTGRSRADTAPPGAKLLAVIASPPMRTLVALTDVPSDNFFAEMLVKDLGAYFGHAGTTSAGAGVVRRWLNPIGIRPQIYDGSGLDAADHTSPHQVVTLLRALDGQPLGDVLRASLPVAGRTGTLARRMRGSAAVGRCHAKTGTLIGVSALAGWCDSIGGAQFAFALLMNRVGVLTARGVQDRVAETLASYRGAA